VNAYSVRETGKPVWPFVLFDKEKRLGPEEWREIFRQALSNGGTGLIAFPAENMWDTAGYEVFAGFFSKKQK
jgi:hypothetical protein